MKDIGRRVHRWRKKYTPEKTKATIADIHDDMAARYEAAMSAVCISTLAAIRSEVFNVSAPSP